MMTPDRDQLFDIRVVERNITRGKVTREEYEAFLAEIPDAADHQEISATNFIYTRIVGPQWDDDGTMADEDDIG